MRSVKGSFKTTYSYDTADFDGIEEQITVAYSFIPSSPETRMDQEAPAEVEILRVEGEDKRFIKFDELPDKVQDSLREQAIADAGKQEEKNRAAQEYYMQAAMEDYGHNE